MKPSPRFGSQKQGRKDSYKPSKKLEIETFESVINKDLY